MSKWNQGRRGRRSTRFEEYSWPQNTEHESTSSTDEHIDEETYYDREHYLHLSDESHNRSRNYDNAGTFSESEIVPEVREAEDVCDSYAVRSRFRNRYRRNRRGKHVSFLPFANLVTVQFC